MTDDRTARQNARREARDRRRWERRQRWGVEPGLVFGILLLVVGAALLLQNTGALDVDWDLLWPLLLIALGVVVLAGAMFGFGRGGGSGETSVTVPADGAGRLELFLRLGAGRYRLAGGNASLVDVNASEPSIVSRVERQGDLARVRLSPAAERWGWTWRGGFEWQIAVARDVPTVLDVQAGAGAFELDLSDMSVASASIGIGAAELRLVLPRPRGDVPIRVEGGAAQMTFQVPPGVEARVATSGFLTTSGRPETPGYATATDRVTVSVTGGAASVRVI
jgi:uncharacterized integral membrane protein